MAKRSFLLNDDHSALMMEIWLLSYSLYDYQDNYLLWFLFTTKKIEIKAKKHRELDKVLFHGLWVKQIFSPAWGKVCGCTSKKGQTGAEGRHSERLGSENKQPDVRPPRDGRSSSPLTLCSSTVTVNRNKRYETDLTGAAEYRKLVLYHLSRQRTDLNDFQRAASWVNVSGSNWHEEEILLFYLECRRVNVISLLTWWLPASAEGTEQTSLHPSGTSDGFCHQVKSGCCVLQEMIHRSQRDLILWDQVTNWTKFREEKNN